MKTRNIPMALMVFFILAGCGKFKNDTVRIGVIAEITGAIPAVGASCKNGAQMAAKEINDAGGIMVDGVIKKIELFIEDSASKPEQAATVTQKLITYSKVIAIVGPNSSSNALPAAEIAEKAGMVLMTPWSTDPKTTIDAKSGQPKKFVFRACFTDTFEGKVLGGFARKELKANKVAILYDVASDVLKIQAEIFRKSFEKNGGTIVAFETYTKGDKDFSAQFTKIKSAKPDLIFLPSYYTDVPLQVQQARRLGIKVPFLGSDAWSSEDLVRMCGADCEGSYLLNHYSPGTTNPVTQKFIAQYRAQFGGATPDDVAALAYDALGVLVKAIALAGKLDRSAVRDALSQVPAYPGVTGVIKYSAGSGDPVKGAVILRIKNGGFAWFADAQP
ncbi:MAG: ABC transporter substrate-binding protein [Elusimicrobiota bacterium]